MSAQLVVYISLALLCIHQPCFSQGDGALQRYVAQKDSAFRWKAENIARNREGNFYELSLRSQRWQGIDWTHRLMVYLPKKGKHRNTVLLILRHQYNQAAGIASLKYISDSTGTASAILYDIPNQPLFGGREEDDLQAYTFSKFMETGDESWPLLFPMVKTVTRTMDAVQELARNEEKLTVSKFIVAGHSKRGHTAWLAAAVDSRIKGIIPIAIDVLNAKAQLPHHVKMFGTFSTPSKDATNFLKELDKPLGDRLIELIDPYAYKEQLSLPKLIVSATNDEYFPTDALNLYWEGLKGSKSILFLSNAGHVRADSDPRINPTAFAFVRALAADKALPSFHWEFRLLKDSVHFIIHTDASAASALLWQARSDSNDFRASQWHATPMNGVFLGSTKRYEITIARSSGPNGFVYGEIELEQDGHKFLLTTQTYRYSHQ